MRTDDHARVLGTRNPHRAPRLPVSQKEQTCASLRCTTAVLSFGSLAIIICVLNVPALALEFLALITFRIRRPNAARGFKVPGGWSGLCCVCVTFLSVASVVLVATLREWRSFPGQLLVVGIIAASGLALYFFHRRSQSSTR
jgi:hypothetical protein